MAKSKTSKKQSPKRKPRRKTPYAQPGRKGFLPGNPGGGRPKGSFSMRTLLRKSLQEARGKREIAQGVIDAMLAAALQGKPWAVQMAFEHIDGKPTQTVVNVEDRRPLKDLDRDSLLKAAGKRRSPPEDDA